jgi:hypothetical protein
MTVTISIFALLMVILVIHTIFEHLTNWVIRLLWPRYMDGGISFSIILVTLMRWVFTVSLIDSLLS